MSGKSISFSSPPGHFRDVYIPHIDLKSQNKNVTLFSQSWVFSGFLADQGALDFGIGLSKVTTGNTESEFLDGIKTNLSNVYAKIFPNGIELKDISKKQMGGREWLCYTISNWRAECSIKIDSEHYLTWKLAAINNLSTKSIKARDELANKIEQSVTVAF